MKHLFIINPVASGVRNKVRSFQESIGSFFEEYGQFHYDIHITRWARDAMGYVRRYLRNAGELVRVHVFGGSGTLFEVLNGSIGLPNVQIAAYPLGESNNFLQYFGTDKTQLFMSVPNQVFSDVISVDVIHCGSCYGISYGIVGLEAVADKEGTDMIERTNLPINFCYLWSAARTIISSKSISQSYRFNLDGMPLDGEYISILVAGAPCYGSRMCPAVEAHPNDGLLDIYMVKSMSRNKLLRTVPTYLFGNYHKIPDRITHFRGKRISISSEQVMCMSVDGEAFYEHSIAFDVVPKAIDFVCPAGIDIKKLPRIYNRPEEGCIGDGLR